MVAVPAVFFYAATVALIIVCVLLAVLLFFLIQAVRSILDITEQMRKTGRKVGGVLSGVRRAVGLAFTFFR